MEESSICSEWKEALANIRAAAREGRSWTASAVDLPANTPAQLQQELTRFLRWIRVWAPDSLADDVSIDHLRSMWRNARSYEQVATAKPPIRRCHRRRYNTAARTKAVKHYLNGLDSRQFKKLFGVDTAAFNEILRSLNHRIGPRTGGHGTGVRPSAALLLTLCFLRNGESGMAVVLWFVLVN